MLRSKSVIEQRLWAVYVGERKEFDRECQKAKKEYQRKMQYQIQSLDSTYHQEFWKQIGKIGVGRERQDQIPVEIILPCGSISSDAEVVLEAWRKNLKDLLNPMSEHIRMLHGCEVRIENSVPRVSVWHHEALPSDAKQ